MENLFTSNDDTFPKKTSFCPFFLKPLVQLLFFLAPHTRGFKILPSRGQGALQLPGHQSNRMLMLHESFGHPPTFLMSHPEPYGWSFYMHPLHNHITLTGKSPVWTHVRMLHLILLLLVKNIHQRQNYLSSYCDSTMETEETSANVIHRGEKRLFFFLLLCCMCPRWPG